MRRSAAQWAQYKGRAPCGYFMAEEESRVERRLDLPGERTALVVRVVIADPSDAHQVQLRESRQAFLSYAVYLPLLLHSERV